MVRLGAGAHLRILDLDEVADVHAVGERRVRTGARERPDVAVRADLGGLDHAAREHLRVVANRGVADHDVRSDAHAVAERHAAFEHHVDVDEHVAAGLERAANVYARRVGQRHAGLHQRAGTQTPILRLHLGQLQAVVDAEHLGNGRRHQRTHGDLLLHGHLDDIGQVVLALRVRIAQLAEPLAQQLRGHRHHAGVALADRELLPVRVLLLDDLLHAAALVAHDATVAGGIGKLDSQQAHRTRPGERDQLGECLAADQRHVAVEDQHEMVVGDRRHRLHHRMAGAELLGLQRPADLRRRERRAHLFAAMPVHDFDRRGMQRGRSFDHMAQQRATGERLQHLGPVGVHALALACGQDHDRQVHALQPPLIDERDGILAAACDARPAPRRNGVLHPRRLAKPVHQDLKAWCAAWGTPAAARRDWRTLKPLF